MVLGVGFCAPVAIRASAQTFTTLASFDASSGESPGSMSLVQGFDGSFYGTTQLGGAHNSGTVFKVTSGGMLTALHSFVMTDGFEPSGGLVQAINGNFYGTAASGGNSGCADGEGCGTIFRMTPGGRLTTLYSFCSQPNCTDGSAPEGGLVQATDGSFYGTTLKGGSSNQGTVFKVAGDTLTTLHDFCTQTNCPDGWDPVAGLVQATDGNFYGTTLYGGATGGVGTVFKITSSGTLKTLYTFCSQNGCIDGVEPNGRLVQAADGNFYGTTQYSGGPSNCNLGNMGCGSVFKLTRVGSFEKSYLFDGPHGAFPYAGLVQATDGNFYGMTESGGANTAGTIFKVTPGGALTTLYNFCAETNCPDGFDPYGGLVQGTDGNLYGTTNYGGANGFGTVFSLSLGLSPFVKTLPSSGKMGATVIIMGTNLTGADSVTFNGTATAFTVVSNSEITATVPSGATSGVVSVTTPAGVLNSNQAFQVKP